MKSKITLLVIFTWLLSFDSYSQDIFEKWKELDQFHDMIAFTFHPAEDGDFEPIKEDSGKLLDAAKKLANSNIPNEFQTDAIKEQLEELVSECSSINKEVKGGKASDDSLMKGLSQIHDTYHAIVELCREESH